MAKRAPRPQSRLYLAAVFVLAAGLAAAAAIYATAEDDAGAAMGYAVINGQVYAISGTTKAYTHELQRFGGKAALLFDDFNRWFAGLWHGRTLALTVAWLSIGASFVLYLVAGRLPEDPRGAGEDEPR